MPPADAGALSPAASQPVGPCTGFADGAHPPTAPSSAAMRARPSITIGCDDLDTSRGWGPTLESNCQFIFDHTDRIVREASGGRARIVKIEAWEKGDNRAAKSFE